MCKQYICQSLVLRPFKAINIFLILARALHVTNVSSHLNTDSQENGDIFQVENIMFNLMPNVTSFHMIKNNINFSMICCITNKA